jgi:hypothetical protein
MQQITDKSKKEAQAKSTNAKIAENGKGGQGETNTAEITKDGKGRFRPKATIRFRQKWRGGGLE